MRRVDSRHIVPMVVDAVSLAVGGISSRRHRASLVEVGRTIRHNAFEARDNFPVIELPELLAKIGKAAPDVALPSPAELVGNTIGGIIPYYYIGAIAAAIRPQTVFEVGTYLGLSALTFALNSDAHVFTVDLPEDFSGGDTATLTQGDKHLVDEAAGNVGRAFRNHAFSERITQIRCNSLQLNVGSYVNSIDMIFIDGGHSYELVKNDTEKCLPFLAPGGLIIWDDYRWNLPGVSQYLQELLGTHSLRRIQGTQYVVFSNQI